MSASKFPVKSLNRKAVSSSQNSAGNCQPCQPNPTVQTDLADPVLAAKAAKLRYVTDSIPGIRRRRHGKGFRYIGKDGNSVLNPDVLHRIKALVIPPAWKDVWICPIPNGHLQATGRDARGRKQSRYHPRWREVRDETKYQRMIQFGETLPQIRDRVEHDLALPGLPRDKILATIVRLLETTFIRVGNEEYARQNHSYGLTTMRNKHVEVEGSTLRFNFKGKSGVTHEIDLNDRRLARIVKRCLDVPGYELFQYLDRDGVHHAVDASDVNEYLSQISGHHYTARDFRTWAGTVLACTMLRQFDRFESHSQAKKNVVEAIKSVAKRLGNTPSVCRKCYVHPAVLETYMDGNLVEAFAQQVANQVASESESHQEPAHNLRREEQDVLHLLRQRLTTAA